MPDRHNNPTIRPGGPEGSTQLAELHVGTHLLPPTVTCFGPHKSRLFNDLIRYVMSRGPQTGKPPLSPRSVSPLLLSAKSRTVEEASTWAGRHGGDGGLGNRGLPRLRHYIFASRFMPPHPVTVTSWACGTCDHEAPHHDT
jgi:hypothetical protein